MGKPGIQPHRQEGERACGSQKHLHKQPPAHQPKPHAFGNLRGLQSRVEPGQQRTLKGRTPLGNLASPGAKD